MSTSSAALTALCERYWDFVCEEQPLTAILAGRKDAGDRLLRESPEDHARRCSRAQALRAELQEIPLEPLQGQDRTTYRLLDHDLQIGILAYETQDHLRPSLYPLGPEAMLNYWADSTALSRIDDAERYIRRLRSIPEALTGITACLEAGIEQGIRYPKIVVERAVSTVRALLSRPLEQNSLIRPLLQSTVKSAEMQALRQTAESVLTGTVIPAITAYAEFLEQRLAAAARESIACTDAPQGEAYYGMLIERYTTERDRAAAIHQFGLDEVTRISGEMRQIAAQAGYPDDLPGYRTSLLAQPGQILASAEALRERIEVLSKRIDARVPEFFGRLPRMSYGVRSIPVEVAPYMPPAYAQPNPADCSAAGVHWITSLPERNPSYMHIPMSMHEAWPGHLMHLALMQEMELPEFRRHGGARYSACVEGWALYCEWLGNEFGLYDTADKHYGRLEMEIWRACRLVVDTGIHAKGWTRDQAIDFMVSHMAMPIDTIRAEVDRYIGMPGQALAYQIGYRCVRSIRAEAESRLGSAFRLRDFHDALMAAGAVTLPAWKEVMQDWAGQAMARDATA